MDVRVLLGCKQQKHSENEQSKLIKDPKPCDLLLISLK